MSTASYQLIQKFKFKAPVMTLFCAALVAGCNGGNYANSTTTGIQTKSLSPVGTPYAWDISVAGLNDGKMQYKPGETINVDITRHQGYNQSDIIISADESAHIQSVTPYSTCVKSANFCTIQIKFQNTDIGEEFSGQITFKDSIADIPHHRPSVLKN